MPANLTPDYMAAERRLREAKTDAERLEALQEMLRTIPKHKGTDKMQADLKRRISKLKEKIEQQSHGKKKGPSYKIHREGAGAVALAGPPNVGKSSLFQSLTGVEARIGEYPFTTLEPHPGMMPFENIKIELVDLPPLSMEHTEPWVFDLIKSCDAFLAVVDLAEGDPLAELKTVLDLAGQHHLKPRWEGALVEPETGPDVVRPALVVANKADAPEAKETLDLFREMLEEPLPLAEVSAATGAGIEPLRRRIYDLLGIMRIYSKVPGHPADLNSPFTIHRGATLIEFAQSVHQDFMENLKFGKVWGSSKFDGMIAKRDYVLQDGDVVELHI